MKLLRSFSLLILIFLLSETVSAQQDPMYTQFMFNKLVFNPAYAGSRPVSNLTLLYRDQWTGFEGAPQTMTASFHSQLANPQYGLGVTLFNDRLGIQSTTGLNGNYAYRIPVGDGALALGVSAGFTYHRMGLTEAVSIQDNDPNLAADFSRFLPNVGLGIYFHLPTFFAGVSAPHLIENELTERTALTDLDQLAFQHRHYYAMLGTVVDLSEALKFRPSVLVKYVDNAPVEADINGSFLIKDVLWIGATYRTNASVDGNIEAIISDKLMIGYAYDYQLNGLSDHTNGSHEVILSFDFKFKDRRVVTPRKVVPKYF